MKTVSLISQFIIRLFILLAILYGWAKKVRVCHCFVSGAKGGVGVVVRVFPYLLAIFVAVKAFQGSGAFEFAQDLLRGPLGYFHVPIDVVPIALIKPLSGSASLGVFTNIVIIIQPQYSKPHHLFHLGFNTISLPDYFSNPLSSRCSDRVSCSAAPYPLV